MKVPNIENGEVPERKIVYYLLDISHSRGQSKARFFLGIGYTLEKWKLLAEELKRHAEKYEVEKTEEALHGTRYIVKGNIQGLNGKGYNILAVWFVENGKGYPRLVSAYPA